MNAWKWIMPLSVISGVIIVLTWVLTHEKHSKKSLTATSSVNLEYHNRRLQEVNKILSEEIFIMEKYLDDLQELIIAHELKAEQLHLKK